MSTFENIQPFTKLSVERYVKLQVAIARLDVVRALIVDDTWIQPPYNHMVSGKPAAKIGPNRILMPETDETGKLFRPAFTIAHNMGRGEIHEVIADATGYQTIEHNVCGVMAMSQPLSPEQLLEAGHYPELLRFVWSANAALGYFVKLLPE